MVHVSAGRFLVQLERAERLRCEGTPPVDEQRPVAGRRRPWSARRRGRLNDRLERIDSLPNTRFRADVAERSPGCDELLDLGHRADHSRKLIDRARERFERLGTPARENEVVGRRPERGARDRAVRFHDPLDVFWVQGGVVAESSREAEDQVVPSLVSE